MLAAILDPDLVPGEPNLLVGDHDEGGHDVLDHDQGAHDVLEHDQGGLAKLGHLESKPSLAASPP